MPTIYVPRLFGGMLILGNALTQITPNITLYMRSGVVEQNSPTFAAVPDDYSPIYAGDTGAVLAPLFLHKFSGTPVDLNNATISMKLFSTGVDATVKTCNGPWSIDDPLNGKAHYQWQSTDINMPGTWNLYITVTIGNAPMHADAKPLTILLTP